MKWARWVKQLRRKKPVNRYDFNNSKSSFKIKREIKKMETTNQTPIQVIEKFLANTANPEVINRLVAPDATYVSLTFENKDLKRILP